MKIQCQDHPVEHILTSNYFEIPRFQRPYSWEKENWEDFWNDALSTKKDDYFIGSVVTYAKGQSKAIVDGQQRLTTITIILSAIRNSYRKFGYEDRATGTQLFIERNNKNNEATFVLKTETSYPYLQTGIQSFQPQKQKIKLGEEESLLQGAFQYFTNCIDEETNKIQTLSGVSETTRRSKIKNKLDELRDAVLSLKLIYVELDNEDDAYQVFETLNTRGKDLATTDLLKNHLARLLREKNPLNDDVKVRWSFTTDNIKSISADGIDLDGFLYHYWISNGNFTQKKDIFKAIKENVNNKVSAKKLLDDLQTYSEVYRDLHEPGLRKWRNDELDIKIALEAINRFRVKHPIPLMMIALRKYDTKVLPKSELLNIFQTIETFTFINTNLMNARSSGGVAQMYAFHAKSLASATETTRRKRAIDEFVTKLSLKIPPQSIFQEKFKALRYSDKFPLQKKEIQYVVTRLFSEMFPAVAINAHEMSIEHIEPQSSIKIDEATVASIGNLWFLKTAFNNALGNMDATLKLQQYKNSHLPCDKILNNATSWGKQEINARTDELCTKFWEMIENRFKITSL